MNSRSISQYSRREKVVAALEMSSRMRERWASSPHLMHLADELGKWAHRMDEAYGGIDTRGFTDEVQAADEARDSAARALYYYLKAIINSAAHRDAWEAASRLLGVINLKGVDWVYDAYAIQTLRMHEVLRQFAEMGAEIETCSARVFVDQLAAAQDNFEKKLAIRGHLISEKPETVSQIAPEFERVLRVTFLTLEGLPDDADRSYVLEPITALRRKSKDDETKKSPTTPGQA